MPLRKSIRDPSTNHPKSMLQLSGILEPPRCGSALAYADGSLRADREMALKAVQQLLRLSFRSCFCFHIHIYIYIYISVCVWGGGSRWLHIPGDTGAS